MKEILQNIALVNTTEYCKAHNLDCSGTYIYKYPRQFKYALCKQDGKAVVTVTYYKNRVPSYYVTPC